MKRPVVFTSGHQKSLALKCLHPARFPTNLNSPHLEVSIHQTPHSIPIRMHALDVFILHFSNDEDWHEM